MFDFDPAKSAANKAKHGMDFEEAQALWLDARLIEIGTVKYDREERQLFVGALEGRCWTAVVTFRNGTIRIISVRRSRRREEMAYQRGGI
jgi:uncharacterized DUF497 family protein